MHLREKYGKTKVLILGEKGLREELARYSHTIVNDTVERPDFVVVGLDRELTYEKLNIDLAFREIFFWRARFPDIRISCRCVLLVESQTILFYFVIFSDKSLQSFVQFFKIMAVARVSACPQQCFQRLFS